jgi:hypothetical protein
LNRQSLRRLPIFFGLLRGNLVEPSNRPIRASKRRRRRLNFELCEGREMLAGASITGITVQTALSSGFSAGDTPQGGVFVDLYKDNGDNVFNPPFDALSDREQSAAGTGIYTFNNVADGHYYIQEEVPTGFSQSAGPAFYTLDVINGNVYTGTATNIDNFTDPDPAAVYFINAVDANPLNRHDTGSGIIGGQRDLTVNVLGPSNPISANGYVGTLSPGTNVFNLGSASSGPGTEVIMHYDANGAGLGANLTAGGANGIRLDFDFLQVGTGSSIDAEALLTSPGGTASFATTITENTSGFSVFWPYSSFSTTGSFSLTNASSIQLTFNSAGVQDVDFQIHATESIEQTNTGYNFGNFPLPASLAGFVYVDTNNNGIKDLGELPIAGVIVTLTGTDSHGNPVTKTTTTDTNGAYSFTGLISGTYTLAETQPINFIDGKDTQGTPGTGVTGNDIFSNIILNPGVNGVNNNFGELGLTPTYASKRALINPPPPVNLVAVYATTITTTTSVVIASAATSTPSVTPSVSSAAKTTPSVTSLVTTNSAAKSAVTSSVASAVSSSIKSTVVTTPTSTTHTTSKSAVTSSSVTPSTKMLLVSLTKPPTSSAKPKH